MLRCWTVRGQVVSSFFGDNVGCNVQKPTSPRRNSCHTNTSQSALLQTKRRARTEATSSPTRMPTSSDPAEGSFLPRESDPTGFMAGVEEVRRGGASNVGQWRGGSRGGELKGGERERCEMAEREMARCTCLRIASGTPAEPFFHNLCRPPPSPPQTQHACCFIPAMQPSPSVRPMHATARAPVPGSMHSARSSQR